MRKFSGFTEKYHFYVHLHIFSYMLSWLSYIHRVNFDWEIWKIPDTRNKVNNNATDNKKASKIVLSWTLLLFWALFVVWQVSLTERPGYTNLQVLLSEISHQNFLWFIWPWCQTNFQPQSLQLQLYGFCLHEFSGWGWTWYAAIYVTSWISGQINV